MEDVLARARRYRTHAEYLGRAHYLAADRAAGRHRALGVPVVVVTAVVSTSIFSSLAEDPPDRWRIVVGVVAAAAAVLAALQTFFGFADAAARHRAAGAAYGGVRREVDLLEVRHGGSPGADRAVAVADLEAIAARLTELGRTSPTVGTALYERARREVDEAHAAGRDASGVTLTPSP